MPESYIPNFMLRHPPYLSAVDFFTSRPRMSPLRGALSRQRWFAQPFLGSVSGHVFAQLTYRESLHDIEASLARWEPSDTMWAFVERLPAPLWATSSELRDWRIFADFALVVIDIPRPLDAAHVIGIDLDQSLYALDSTTIDLRLAFFPWARFRRRKTR